MRTTDRPLKIGGSYEIAFSPSREHVVALGRNVVMWDLVTRKRRFSVHPFSHPSHVTFSPDGQQVAVKNTSGQIVILDSETGVVVTDFANRKDGEGVRLFFGPKGDVLVDASWDGVLFVRDVKDGTVLLREEGDKFGQLFSVGGNIYAYSTSKLPPSDSEPPPPDKIFLRKWPFPLHQPQELPSTGRTVFSLALAPSASKLAVLFIAPTQGMLEVTEIANSKVIASTTVDAWNEIAWSPCESYLACVERNAICIYDAASLLLRYKIPLQYACAVAFSQDGQQVAVGSWEQGYVLTWPALAQYEFSS